MRMNEDGPRGAIARYAFGYSNKKPWREVVVVVLVLVVAIAVVSVLPPHYDH